jgi:hypothetical protein
MNKLFLFSLTLVLFSCSNSGEKLYESNMNFHKEMIAEINDFYESSDTTDLDISKYYSEDFTFYSFSAGSPKGATSNFEDYQNGIFTALKQNGYKINFGHSIYLPGIDEHTYKLDGSVRVYFKVTVSKENSVELSAYRTVNFKNGKISGIWEWADYGGLINQLN